MKMEMFLNNIAERRAEGVCILNRLGVCSVRKEKFVGSLLPWQAGQAKRDGYCQINISQLNKTEKKDC